MLIEKMLIENQNHRVTEVSDDVAVFRELYPELRRFAAVVAPLEVDPDDLVQDALERTLRRRSLAELSVPKSYLCRAILNLASNHRRSLARARVALARMRPGELDHPSYPSDISELMRLPSSQRAILYLHEVEGYTFGEIATLLNLGEHAVAKASQRARACLANELRHEDRP
jgi:RNA polymerase sigma-70 factor (ECF subfamily)